MEKPEKAAPNGLMPENTARRPHRRRSFIICAIALGLYFCTVALMVVGKPGVGLKPGDIAMKDYAAREDFDAVDTDATIYEKQRAFRTTPEVFRPVKEARDKLRGLHVELASTLERLATEPQTQPPPDADKALLQKTAREIKRASGESGWAEIAGKMLALDGFEIIDSDDYRRIEVWPQKITVCGEEGFLPLDRIVSTEALERFLKDRIAASLAGMQIDIDAAKASNLLARLLTVGKDAAPSLRYSADETRRARRAAKDAVAPVVRRIHRGEIILRRARVAERSHIEVLKREAAAYKKNISVYSRLLGCAGTALVMLIIFALGAVYLSRFQPRMLKSEMRFFILALLLLLVLGAAKIIAMKDWQLYVIPISFVSMVLAIAYNPRTAIGISWILAAIIAFMIGGHSDLWPGPTGGIYLLIYLMAGSTVSALGAARIRRRSKLILVGLYTGLIYGLVIWGTGLTAGASLEVMFLNSMLGLSNGLTVGFVVSGILPFIEHWFNILTDISLLELSDQNHPLLKRLIFDAPGTYHHSLIVGNLAEEAAASVGANALLARVGSYFHDIGKLRRPEYFIENEAVPGTKHSRLTAPMSTAIILAHTRDGVEMAGQYNLPNKIKAIIRQHHGTSVLEYFYHEALREFGGEESVDVAAYRYPGPRPDTREAGIVLLADACEAASRALVNPTLPQLTKLVDDLVTKKISDGQLDDTQLTLTDIARCKDSFVRVLSSRFHTRVKYPEFPPLDKKDEGGDTLKQPTVFYTRRRPEK